MTVFIPSNWIEHLCLNYGKLWYIPDKNFSDGGKDYIKEIVDGVEICRYD
jgi:hypothetical protein